MIVAKGDPLLVIVLQRKDPCVGTVCIGQELAESVDIFERAGIESVKAPALVNRAYRVNELPFGSNDCRRSIRKSPRLAGFRPALLRALLLVR